MLTHKFHAKSCEADGKRFASKAERSYYQRLKLLQKSGEIIFFLRQVPFELPGDTTYRADFLTFNADGTVHVIDVKGFETAEFKIKRRLLEETYPVTLEVVKNAN